MSTQTRIHSITVENVRGISRRKFVFENPEMLGNKFHLLVAPNGFGKSSLAGAFSSLKPRSLRLPSTLLHNEVESNRAKLEITYSAGSGEETVSADENSNSISRVFSIAVINSRLKPRAVAKTGFNKFAKPTASLIVEPIVLTESIPIKPTKKFPNSYFKQRFGSAGKILPNIQHFLENEHFLKGVLSLSEAVKFSQKKVWKQLNPIISDINSQIGKSDQILAWVESNKLSEFQSIPELEAIVSLLANFPNLSKVEKVLLAYQFALAYKEDSKYLHNHLIWISYLNRKKRCEGLLKSANSNPNWISVSIKETKGALVVEFPVATRMSNGQRDLLSFVAQLMKADFELTGKRAILVVDEVFDYLDECNMLAAQFFVSRFIDHFKSAGSEIFPLFLTHLDPVLFKHSVLGLGKGELRKVHILDKASDSSRNSGIAPMVRRREDDGIRPYIGKYFFHYHPENYDCTEQFKSKNLKATWGKSHKFYFYIFSELKKYLSSVVDVDYVAACVAVRVSIEKSVYDNLPPEFRTKYIEQKGTVDKLNYAEQVGVAVPESHRLLGLLYNDILHHKENFDYISATVSKMKNPAIREMMREVPIPMAI